MEGVNKLLQCCKEWITIYSFIAKSSWCVQSGLARKIGIRPRTFDDFPGLAPKIYAKIQVNKLKLLEFKLWWNSTNFKWIKFH